MELSQVKTALNELVLFNGTKYVLTGCTIRKDKQTQEIFYQAEIADIKAKSVLITRLSDIEIATKGIRPI